MGRRETGNREEPMKLPRLLSVAAVAVAAVMAAAPMSAYAEDLQMWERTGGNATMVDKLVEMWNAKNPDRKIVLRWEASEGEAQPGYKTTVTMEFTPLDGDTRTLVSITEEGWRENEAALGSSYGNCMGWSQMLAAMKAWIEHGINLREGMYK